MKKSNQPKNAISTNNALLLDNYFKEAGYYVDNPRTCVSDFFRFSYCLDLSCDIGVVIDKRRIHYFAKDGVRYVNLGFISNRFGISLSKGKVIAPIVLWCYRPGMVFHINK